MASFVESKASPSLPLNAFHDHYYDVADSFEEDVCSICLDSFTTQDPSTVTCCKHEYHLQCILEWSQRSKECPICWQDLVLKDPSSQELLAAVESERNLRAQPRSPQSFSIIPNFHEDFDIGHDTSYSDDSDLDERIMQHLVDATASRALYISSAGSQRSSELAGRPHEDQTQNSPEERHYSSSGIVVGESSNSNILSTSNVKPSLTADPSAGTIVPISAVNSTKPRKEAIDSPQRSRAIGLSFSESMKLRFSVASSRCKESISKGTRGFKEKLLVRNTSVKELRKGVQREVKLGIAGVAKVIERLDLSSKRSVSSVSDSKSTARTSIAYSKGKNIQGNDITHNGNDEDGLPDCNSGVGSDASTTIPSCVKVSLIKNGH